MNKAKPGRKIPLDTEIYCPYTCEKSGGDSICDHDFDPKPLEDKDEYAVWVCTRCGMRVTYEVWE